MRSSVNVPNPLSTIYYPTTVHWQVIVADLVYIWILIKLLLPLLNASSP